MATDETTSNSIEVSQSAQRPPTAAERRATEHAGTTDTDVLVRDIEQTRAELSVTIDAIVDRVSPKKVVERSKQQARDGVTEATEIVKVHATTAAGVVREKALVASEVVKEKVAELKDRASGAPDSGQVRSPLTPATSVHLDSATPVTAPAPSPGASPLPRGTVSIDAGALPPPEEGPAVGAAGADLPSHRPVATSGATSVPPVYAGAGAAALLTAVLLLLHRRNARRRTRVVRRR